MKKYNCTPCNYHTDNLFNYNKHKATKKHIRLHTIFNVPKNWEKYPICPSNLGKKVAKIVCEYCKKTLSAKKHLTRHLQTCKEKQKHMIQELQDQLKKVQEEKEEIEQEYIEFMKETASKNAGNIIYNDNKRAVNMFYVFNNFKEPRNFGELMSPELSDKETKYILDTGPTTGSYRLLTDRCITGIDVEDRPFHCVDESRNKYLLRIDNDWKVDKDASMIIEEAISKVRTAYDVNVKRTDSKKVIERKLKHLGDLFDFEKTGRKKVLRELNQTALLRNNVNENQ